MAYKSVCAPHSLWKSLYSKGFLRHTTPHLWHILGAYVLLIWGVGVVKIIFSILRDKSFSNLNRFGLGFECQIYYCNLRTSHTLLQGSPLATRPPWNPQ